MCVNVRLARENEVCRGVRSPVTPGRWYRARGMARIPEQQFVDTSTKEKKKHDDDVEYMRDVPVSIYVARAQE